MMLPNDRGLFELPVALLALAITVGLQKDGKDKNREPKRREDRALWASKFGIRVLT